MRLAVIGCGSRMSTTVHALRKQCADLRVCALLDPDPAAAARLPEDSRGAPRVADVAGILAARPDAVAVGTRCHLHTPYAIQLAASGLPLILEKPVAIDAAQRDALVAAFRGSRCPVQVGFPLRATTLLRQVKALVDAPDFGPIEHVCATNYVPYGDVYFTGWYRDHRIVQGLFLQKATHDLDYLMHLVGSPITRVAALATHGRVHRDASARRDGTDDAHYHPDIGTPETGMNEDSSSVLFGFADGRHGVYTQVFYSRHAAARRGAILSARRATLDFDWYRGDAVLCRHDRPGAERIAAAGGASHWGGDEGLAADFLAMVADGAPSCAPLSAGLASVNACLAAKESAERGTVVAVPAVPDDIA